LLVAILDFLAAAARVLVVFLAVARAVVVFLAVVLLVAFLAAVVGSPVDTPSSTFLRVAVLRVVFGPVEWFSPAAVAVFLRVGRWGEVPSTWGLVSSVRAVAMNSA